MRLRLWLLDLMRRQHQERRRVLALVHQGVFINVGPTPYYFLTVTNLSENKGVEISHAWFATTPRVELVNPGSPLPARLRVGETWEGWVAATQLTDTPEIELLGRVLLSDGTVVKSRLNRSVPAQGYVAGRHH